MALEIKWTKRADSKLDHLLTYLEQEWGENVVKIFMIKLYSFLEILAEFPEIGAMQVPKKGIRGFTLTKQIKIFYKVEKDQIILLDFFDNRSDPMNCSELSA